MGRRPVKAVLLDTNAWAWSLDSVDRLSPLAWQTIRTSDEVVVSTVSFYEITQKVRLGKWPEMEPLVAILSLLLSGQGGRAAPLTPDIATTAGLIAWTHRDPFDRIIAATAMTLALPLVSTDASFDGIVPRLW